MNCTESRNLLNSLIFSIYVVPSLRKLWVGCLAGGDYVSAALKREKVTHYVYYFNPFLRLFIYGRIVLLGTNLFKTCPECRAAAQGIERELKD